MLQAINHQLSPRAPPPSPAKAANGGTAGSANGGDLYKEF